MARDAVLRDVIRFFVDSASPRWVFRTQLVKLVFLADYETYRIRKQSLTGLDYVVDHQGPFAWDIPNTAGAMEDDEVNVTEGASAYGGREYRYSSYSTQREYENLSAQDRALLQRLWDQYGDYTPTEIVDLVHKMDFVRHFAIDEHIDFRLALADPKDADELNAWRERRPKTRPSRSPNEAAQLMHALHSMRHGEEAHLLP